VGPAGMGPDLEFLMKPITLGLGRGDWPEDPKKNPRSGTGSGHLQTRNRIRRLGFAKEAHSPSDHIPAKGPGFESGLRPRDGCGAGVNRALQGYEFPSDGATRLKDGSRRGLNIIKLTVQLLGKKKGSAQNLS